MPEPHPLVRPTLLEEYAPKYQCVKLEGKEGQSMHYPSRRARHPHSQGDVSVSDSVHAGGGVVHDLAPVLLCKPAKRLLHELLRLGPDRRRVRIV